MASVYDIIQSGQAVVDWMFYVGGMPWAACSTWELTQSITMDQRRWCFFEHPNVLVSGPCVADFVQLYPILDVPGPRTRTVKPGFGTMTGGDWTAYLSDMPVVNNWPGQNRSIVGLEGVTAVADPRFDETIGVATLAQPFRKDDTSIVVVDDEGDRLQDRITASVAANQPYFLWINGECFASDEVDGVSGDEITISAPLSMRGLLRTKQAGHFLNTDNSSLIRVCDAPLNGVIGRPWYLFAFVRDQTGCTDYKDPIIFDHGKVGLDVKFRGGKWSIQCLPWTSWLDREIELRPFESHIKRYYFSRADTVSDNNQPPLKFYEYQGSSIWLELECWLCAADDRVTYKTVTELYAAVATAMTSMSSALGNAYVYNCGPRGPYTTDSTGSDRPRINGPLTAFFRWGDYEDTSTPSGVDKSSAEADEELQRQVVNAYAAPNCGRHFGYDGNGSQPLHLRCYNGSATSAPVQTPEYAMQWHNSDETLDGENYFEDVTPAEAQHRKFPITTTSIGGVEKYRLYLDPEIDVSDVTVGDKIQLGDKSLWFYNAISADNPETSPRNSPTACSALIAAKGTGGGDPDQNYIDIEGAGVFSSTNSTDEYLLGNETENDPAPSTASKPTRKKFRQGQWLFWVPEVHGQDDPWVVTADYDIEASKLSYIIQAILGNTTNAECPEHIQQDSVPDAEDPPFTMYYTGENTLDLSSLNQAIADVSIPGKKFRLRMNGKVNLWKALTEECKFYGLIPTWQYKPSKRQHEIVFIPAGLGNGSLAGLTGRYLKADSIANKSCEVEQARDWILNKIELSWNYDAQQDKHLSNWTFNDASGLAPVGGRTNTLKIQPVITDINENTAGAYSATAGHFITVLNRFNRGLPAFRCSGGVRTWLTHSLGHDCEITYQGVHDPHMGDVGITSKPATIVSVTLDPSTGSSRYVCQLNSIIGYGWAPTLEIPADKSTINGDILEVDDIGGSGQRWCGVGVTSGWYDHWFFDCLVFNETMDAPKTKACSCGDYGVILWEADVRSSPDFYDFDTDGIVAKNIDPRDYATIDGAGTPFLEISGDPGWLAAFDTSKRYYLTFCPFDSTGNQDCQKPYVYFADSSLELFDSGAVNHPPRRWV